MSTRTDARSDRAADSGAADAPLAAGRLLGEVQRSRRRRRVTILVLRVLLLVVLLVAWQLFSGPPGGRWTLVDEFNTSRPTYVLEALLAWIDRGALWPNVLVTFQEAVVGFALGAAVGVAAGFVVGVFTTLGDVLQPFVTAAYSVPRLAIAPLFILWFGIGIESKVIFVSLLVFFLVFFNTLSGVREVQGELVDVLRVMGARPIDVHRFVTLPSATVWIIGGLRISAPYALVGAVTAEIVSSNRGVGYLLIQSSGQLNTAGVFAAIIVLMIMALAISGLVALLDRYLLRWQVKR